MTRILSDWLTYYIDYASNTESPESYHIWTGLSVIAGALQRKTYIKWGHSFIYPNMYVVLVGPSGRTRKGEAMNVGTSLFNEIGVQTIADSTTREALLKVLGESIQNYKDPIDGIIKYHCSASMFSKELSVFLGQKQVQFLADLTDLYDSVDMWKRDTKHQGTDNLKGVCFNLLGATAPDWIQSILPMEAVGGGFTSRIIFVVEEEKGKIVELPTIREEHKQLRKWLIIDLQKIRSIAGEFTFTKEALEAYAAWYREQEKNAKKQIYPIEDSRFRGYCERRATHVKKVSMLLAASRGDCDLVMTLEDFERARYSLARIEPMMPKVFGGLGDSPTGRLIYEILSYIQKVKKATKSDILEKFYRNLGSSAMLDDIERTLKDMKKINTDIKDGIYTYTYIEKNEQDKPENT